MDQPRRSSRLRQKFDTSDRQDDRRAAVAQMMAENREGLGMKVISVMVQRYGVLPKELWDLNSVSDMGAGRGIIYDEKVSKAMFKRMVNNNRYTIISLTIGTDITHKVALPSTLRRVNILASVYNHPLDPIPETLEELVFHWDCTFNQHLKLPESLRKLVLGDNFRCPIIFPPELVELDLGSAHNSPLTLPQRLQRLTFFELSEFNLLLALPASLLSIQFGNSYNQPTILPSGIEEVRIGPSFTHDLALPPSVRKIEWGCNLPIEISEGVTEVVFSDEFRQPVALPASLKIARFYSSNYFHPLTLPLGLEEFEWRPSHYANDSLALPDSLRKLTWGADRGVDLPAELRELVIEGDAPLVLPWELVKVTFEVRCRRHYYLPESVQEVVCSGPSTFTHPATLQHLIVTYDFGPKEIDLSDHTIHKLTVGSSGISIKAWPQGLQELAFAVDVMNNPLRVPEGCRIVGERRPANLIME